MFNESDHKFLFMLMGHKNSRDKRNDKESLDFVNYLNLFDRAKHLETH